MLYLFRDAVYLEILMQHIGIGYRTISYYAGMTLTLCFREILARCLLTY